MTKKQLEEEAKKEAQKTSLKWRLAAKPTLKDIEKMLELKLISNEEARTMLFSEETKDEKVKALEEQIEFLKEVINKMPYSTPQVIYKYITTYTPTYTWAATPWSGTKYLVGNNVVTALASSSGSGMAIGALSSTTNSGNTNTVNV